MQKLHVQMDNKGHLQNEFATSIKTAHETFICKVFFINSYVFTQIWKFKKKIATFFPAQPNWFGQGEAHV